MKLTNKFNQVKIIYSRLESSATLIGWLRTEGDLIDLICPKLFLIEINLLRNEMKWDYLISVD